jgi:hypothetical protein
MTVSKHITPGIWDIPAEAYHAGGGTPEPSLSASIAHVLLKHSPKHAWQQHPRLNPAHAPRESGTMDHGSAVHALLFEGREPHIVDADSWRTNAAKAERDAARAAGMVPLLVKDATVVQAMVAAIGEQFDRLDVGPRPFTDGKAERTLVWQEPNGIWCRARVDWLRDDHTLIEDLKTTTTANPREWTRRRLWEDGKDIQSALYLRGLRTLTGAEADWRFVVVENTPPYALSVISLNPDARALADAKVDRAIALWKQCLDTNEWPAYPRRVCFAELPPWEEARWMEQQALEDMDESRVAA